MCADVSGKTTHLMGFGLLLSSLPCQCLLWKVTVPFLSLRLHPNGLCLVAQSDLEEISLTTALIAVCAESRSCCFLIDSVCLEFY